MNLTLHLIEIESHYQLRLSLSINKSTPMKNILKSSICLMYIICFTNLSREPEGHRKCSYLSPFNVIGSKEDVPVLEGTGSVLETTDLKAFFHTESK